VEAAFASRKARELLVSARQVAAQPAQENSVVAPWAQVNALQRSHSEAQLNPEELMWLQVEMLSLALPDLLVLSLRSAATRLAG